MKIKDKDLQKEKYYGGQYLLQVWNERGKVRFQEPIRGPIAHGWNLNNRFLVYREQSEDEFDISDDVHIVDLRK